MPDRWAIKVIWDDGTEEYLKLGLSTTIVAAFASRASALLEAEQFRMVVGDEIQSINAVPYPTTSAGAV